MTVKAKNITYIIFFVLFITSLGLYQLAFDKNNRFLVFDLAVDTFVRPLARYKQSAAALKNIEIGLSRPEPDAEEIAYMTGELLKINSQINRHVELDTNLPGLNPFHSLQDQARHFQATGDKSGMAEALNRLRQAYPPLGIGKSAGLIARAIFRETLFNAGYLSDYEKELEEASQLGVMFRELLQYANYKLLKVTGEKAVPGKNDWLFYKQGIDYLTMPYIKENRVPAYGPGSAAAGSNPLGAIVKFKQQLNEMGIDLLVVIAPGKASIYPDMLVGSYEGKPEKITGVSAHTQKFIRTLKDLGVSVVDLHKPFLRERKNDPLAGDSLYLKTDTHWSPRGIKLAAHSVAARIKQYPWYYSPHDTAMYLSEEIKVIRAGDVAEMTKLETPGLKPLKISFAQEEVSCEQVFKVLQDSAGTEISRQPYRDDYRHSRILVLGDSFSRIYQTDAPRGAGWISHLAMTLSEPLASIVNNGGASTLVRQKLARKKNILQGKKLVVWEFVERDLQFGAEGWQDVEL